MWQRVLQIAFSAAATAATTTTTSVNSSLLHIGLCPAKQLERIRAILQTIALHVTQLTVSSCRNKLKALTQTKESLFGPHPFFDAQIEF